MRLSIIAALAAGLASACSAETPHAPGKAAPQSSAEDNTMLYQTEFTAIDGTPLPFETYRGQPVLVVNTASRCGFTPQYQGLQALWERYRDKGLVVLGVPSNDFGGQEPGTDAEVKRFCELNYGVDFPLTAKTSVTGTGRHPFFAGVEDTLGAPARPKWNFHKVLVGADGVARAAFPSSVKPQSDEMIAAVETALADM